ncbi:MAG: FAD-dependent thymidylate synthase, partial [Acutalibacteraceae bacterium]|nr:FAD-dependent thymidylate synthase [Acutalibacteraceae bacterium]
ARSLINFFHHRYCNRAQWEIRDVADQMLALVSKVAPNIFKTAGPPCLTGGCPEGKMSCGKLKEVREKYKNMRANF